MNYQKIHDFIIGRARFRNITGYSEKHHIIPRCLGGTNDKNNIVLLTAKEHYIIHMLLIHIYPEESKLIYAFWMMSNRIKTNITSGKIYENARKFVASEMRKNVGTSKAIAKMAKSKLGQTSWKDKKHSEESKKLQSESAKTRITSFENEQSRRLGISKTLSKKVLQYDSNMNLINTFESVTLAAKAVDSYVGSIVKAIQGKKVKKHKNFIWKYEN